MSTSVFIETTIPSYYVSRPSRDLLQFARQELTREWWDTQRQHFDLFTSPLVLEEASQGEPAKATERLKVLGNLPLLDLDEQVTALAKELIESGILPVAATADALHLAVAGVHEMRFLLTWNCKHIANPFLAERLQACFSKHGVHFPIICTPEQLYTDNDDDTQDFVSKRS